MQAPELLALLYELNKLEDQLAEKPSTKKRVQSRIEEIRTEVPKPFLSHHDRIRLKGRWSVGVVKNWTCSGCYIEVPRGLRRQITLGNEILICDHCGGYLYLDPEERAALAEGAAAVK